MTTTTNYHKLFEKLKDKDLQTIYDLYESIVNKTQVGGFDCSIKDGQLFIRNSENRKILILESIYDTIDFLYLINLKYSGEFHSIRDQYKFMTTIREMVDIDKI